LLDVVGDVFETPDCSFLAIIDVDRSATESTPEQASIFALELDVQAG